MLAIILIIAIAFAVHFLLPRSGIELDQAYIHGERLTLTAETDFTTVSLIDDAGQEHQFPAADLANQGIFLPGMSDGRYRVTIDGQKVISPYFYKEEGYGITRNKTNCHWKLYSKGGYLWLKINTVDELPDDVYDIIIDAGHGGVDTGVATASTTEAKENLISALYMAERFRELGLKVALTRTEDISIGQEGAQAGEINPYIENGRIDLIYASQAKYLVSNHLNASVGHNSSGYQIYTSVRTDNGWASLATTALDATGLAPNNLSTGLVEHGSYKRYSHDDEETGLDYYYIIRESGGNILSPYGYTYNNERRARQINSGAEAMLVEYLFLDNGADAAYWQEHKYRLIDAIVKASSEYWLLD